MLKPRGGSVRPAHPGVRFLGVLLFVGCTPPPLPSHGAPGEALPGLPPDVVARFEAGRALFDIEVSEEGGLGPTFNQRRCSSCHDVPTLGGSGVEPIVKSTRWVDGRCDPLLHQGGDNIQARATPALVAAGGRAETRPGDATHTTDLTAPALYGLGVVEAIPEHAILARADPDDADGDGISGRAGRTADGRFARFGRKGTHATLRSFIEEALLQEMGLTTPAHPRELTINGTPPPPEADPASDPEYGPDQIDLLESYLRLLALPGPAEPGAEDAAAVERGRDLFESVGCTGCHTPRFTTSDEAPPSLRGREVVLYSDLLLHDLGPGWAGICSASAAPSEIRTAPLAGLRHRPILSHDGRSTTLADVIRRHGGEAEASVRAYDALGPEARDALLAFLRSL